MPILRSSLVKIPITVCFCFTLLVLSFNGPLWAGEADQIPVTGMVTMVDLGADRCVPCKMMAPIIAKVKKDYEDRAAIIFLDVWRDPGLGKKFGIRAIPTQIFYDRDGKEVYRHLGFMDEKSMVAALQKLGVPPKAVP
jgi:thioredoxin 1